MTDIEGLLIITKLQDQNYEQLQKKTTLPVNKKI